MEDDLLRRDRGKREGPPSPLTQRGRIARIHPASRHQTAFSTAFPPDCCRMRRARRDGLQPHQGPNPQPTRFPTRAAVPIPREDYAIGRAHACTPVTNAHIVYRLLLDIEHSRHPTEYI